MAQTTKIGLDFDNTIARYDASFWNLALDKKFVTEEWDGRGKKELRDHLRLQPDGETAWMKLQGLVYGKFMYRAEIMYGVANFLLKCKSLKHRVFIISHKTEFGHFDQENFLLRQEALKWMEGKRFFDPDYFGIKRENVFFFDTREEKIEKITQLECDYFIDDLQEVLLEKNFPLGTKKILFGQYNFNELSNDLTPMNNWRDISDYVLGDTTSNDVGIWANLLLPHSFETIEKISGRGNSCIYKIVTDRGKCYALKHYPDQFADVRLRLKNEFTALKFLRNNKFENIPEAVKKDDDLNVGLYSWVEGSIIESPDRCDLDQAIEFIRRLHILSKNSQNKFHSFASESCLSANILQEQIVLRLKRLESIPQKGKQLNNFLNNIFIPIWKRTIEKCLNSWPKSSIEKSLEVKNRILSPSDFGFHNAIKNNGELYFIDFEYFGWDDPVKLTADFIWHPGMSLNLELISVWKDTLLNLFSSDKDFEERLHAAIPLYGLRWALILLNEFIPEYYKRRKNTGKNKFYNKRETQIEQLKKAEIYCKKVRELN